MFERFRSPGQPGNTADEPQTASRRSRTDDVEIESLLDLNRAAALIASLGQGLETGRLEVGERSFAPAGLKSLKISLKCSGRGLPPGQCKLKLKIKSALDRSMPTDQGAPSGQAASACRPDALQPKSGYKSLKNRMKRSYKAIRSSIEAGILPDDGLVDEFVADSGRMVAYPGYGDPMYPAYTASVLMLRDAVRDLDLAAATVAVGELEHLKRECHKLYK